MELGVRAKLFGVSVALILIVGLTSGLYLQRQLRGAMVERIEVELTGHARTLVELVQAAGGDHSVARIDHLADRLSAAAGIRVTIVAPDGRVLGESDVETAAVTAIANHGARPEVLAALARGHGTDRRHSATVRQDMLYVAVPFDHPEGRAVARVAKPLEEVDAALGRLRVLLLLAGLIGLAVAALVGGLASHFLSRTLRALVDSARAIAGGDPRRRVEVSGGDELGGLAGSLNRMAEEIEQTVTALASERARFRDVLEGMTEAVIALDAERRITLINPAAAELLGVPADAVGDLLVEHVRAPALQALLASPLEARADELELPATGRQVAARVTPQRDGAGCVLVIHDVTEIRRLERIRRDFVANVSHELRTPVSVMSANAETLLDGAMEDGVHGRRLLEAVHRNAQRLSRIIAELLDLSRLEAGRYPVELGALGVAEAVRRATEAVDRAAREKDIAISVEVDPALRARADETALEQALVNLLDNAVKYTPAGGHVVARARLDGDQIRIEVADDGPGIAPQHRARIFERFYRIDPGRSRDMGGTGLGLSIVKHLIEAMDGQVGVQPGAPGGAVFWLTLPAAQAA